MRFFKRRCVTYTRGIEHGDVRFHSRPEQPTIGETETLSRKRRHFTHSFFKSDRIQLAHINSKHTRESAIVTRMRIRFPKDGNPSVRRNHCCGMAEDAAKVFLGDCVKDARTVALF